MRGMIQTTLNSNKVAVAAGILKDAAAAASFYFFWPGKCSKTLRGNESASVFFMFNMV